MIRSEEFVRYYIGNVNLYILERIQKDCEQLEGWIFYDADKFEYTKSYGYLLTSNTPWMDTRVRKVLGDCTVVAEHHDPQNLGPSLLWRPGRMVVTVLDDVLSLCSVATNNPCFILGREHSKKESLRWDRAVGLISSETDSIVVPLGQLGHFISGAMTTIKEAGWADRTGFNPAVYWYTQAQLARHTNFSDLEVALYWVALEVLALAYVRSELTSAKLLDQKGQLKSKLQGVERFVAEKGYVGSEWDLLTGLIKDWYQIRNTAFHEGSRPQQPRQDLGARSQQIKLFSSLVLTELLQRQPANVRSKVAQDIKNMHPRKGGNT